MGLLLAISPPPGQDNQQDGNAEQGQGGRKVPARIDDQQHKNPGCDRLQDRPDSFIHDRADCWVSIMCVGHGRLSSSSALPFGSG